MRLKNILALAITIVSFPLGNYWRFFKFLPHILIHKVVIDEHGCLLCLTCGKSEFRQKLMRSIKEEGKID